MSAVCVDFAITPAQYNVLRILNGVYPAGHPRCEIIARMLEPAPDVTRLLDRLAQQGFVDRDVSSVDKRMSIARISRKGLHLLEKIRPAVKQVEGYLASRLSTAECIELSHLCEKIYTNEI